MSTVLQDYMTPSELAAQLGVCVKTLDRWRADGAGPPVTKVGRKLLYRRASVTAWLQGCELRAA
jgi:excisionase family DNA binding protein